MAATKMEATKVRDLPVSRTGATQALYRLNPPYEVRTYEGEVAETTEFVVVSAVDAMFSGPETFIFPADENGEVTDWGELPGSYRGGYDHDAAVAGLIDSASRR